MPFSESRHQAVVVLDPGHGGEHAAGRSTPNRAVGRAGTLEKDLVLDVARRIRPMLEADGVKVLLTRDGDSNPSLGQRAETARRVRASAFVSLHLSDGERRGTLTCVHRQGGSAGISLAAHVHRSVIRAVGTADLGLHAGPLAVLEPRAHAADTACCLVELSSLCDPDEERRLGTVDYRSELAGAVSRAILDWLHRRGASPVPALPSLSRSQPRTGHKRALLVGIDDYSRVASDLGLRFATRDIWSMAAMFSACFGVGQNGTRMLRDHEATGSGILAGLRALAQESAADDVLCLAFSGRGTVVSDGRPALVAADGVALTADNLRAALSDTPLRGLWVVADAGFAGAPADPGGKSVAPEQTTGPERPAEPSQGGPQLRWLAAAGPDGDAFEHAACGHGLFTSAFLRFVHYPDFDIGQTSLHRRLDAEVDALVLRLGILSAQKPQLDSYPDGGTTEAVFLASPSHVGPAPVEAVHHIVPLVPQMVGMSCWAAAAAMLIGWRDRIPVRGAEVARGAGRWESYRKGLRPSDIGALARSWGLVAEPPRTYRVDELARLLRDNGPLWVGEADPDLHVVVVAGMWGDGTIDGTQLMVLDPWPVKRGERYTLSFRELTDNLHAAGQIVGHMHAQVLHTGSVPRPGRN